jgi:hypothetical protein
MKKRDEHELAILDRERESKRKPDPDALESQEDYIGLPEGNR